MEIDMTNGRPLKLIMRFMLPVLIGNLFLRLYNTADSIIVGRFVGLQALAAVGAAGTVMELVLGFVQGLSSGFAVLTAQCYGAGDIQKMRASIGNSIVLAALSTLVMTVFSLYGMDMLLVAMKTPEDMYEMTRQYLMIICGGMVCQVWYSLISNILRAVGNSKLPLVFLMISSAVNIVLDILLICVFHMGIRGAAIATVFSQGLSGILCLIWVLKKIPLLHVSPRDFRLRKDCVKSHLIIGIPMALQYSVTAVGAILIQIVLNQMGAAAVGAYTASYKILQVVMEFYCALGMTMSIFTAQNKGRGNTGRILNGTSAAMCMLCIYSVVMYGILLLSKNWLIQLFLREASEKVMGYAGTYLIICGAFMIPLGMIFLYRNVLQGYGFAILSTLGGVLELVSRAAVAFVAVYYNSYVGACFSNVVAWVTAGGFLWLSYLIVIRRKAGREKMVI